MAIYNGFETEKDVLFYWKEKKIFDKLRNRNEGKKHFSFIDGPITANNPMGVHHAWGRTLKDLFQRYKAMQGCDERYQNGFDCQGLWLEVETEKDLGFNSKKDIENFGLDTFSKACRRRVEKFSKVQTEQSMHLGQWMDWGNDYYTMSNTNIEAIWFFLKKCHEKGWLYKGYRILPWCIRCGTSSSKHEMSDEGYADLVHPSVYIKAKIKGRENEYLLIWTTTEWTLSSNVAAAVNPEINYVQVRKGGDIYYISEATMSKVGGDSLVLENLKGADLVGLEYESFYPEIDVQKGVFPRVVPWNEVGEKDGTGIVHIAPNCGQEDYELGKRLKLKILNPALDDFGNYNSGYGWLSGKNVREIKKEIINDLEKRGFIFAVENYKHRYPICWRCKEELVFRLDSSWFIACDEIRPIMKKEAAKVEWYPEHTGKLMQDWLENMEDWNISRRRYWGLPLMFYECKKCENIEVIGSKKEFREKAVNKKEVDELPELHRPWIDNIKIKCKCGGELERIKEVGDCWLDAGIVPFSTLKYFENKEYWKKWFPADLEIEMRSQVRLWFYAQLFMSVVLEGVVPYKRILVYEEVRDEKGESMHKSKGNAIWFNEAVEKIGADVMRWQYCNQNPQFNLNFGYGPAKEIQRYLLIIDNLANYVKQNCVNPAKQYSKDPASLWILSKRENLKIKVTDYLDCLEYHRAIEEIKNFLLTDLSKIYVQFIRDGLEDRKVQKVLYDSYFDGITLLAPFLPFFTEKLNLEVYKNESIHLQPWPRPDNKLINPKLESAMNLSRDLMQGILAARDKEKINVRWPLKKATVYVHKDHKEIIDKIKPFVDSLILKQTNIKEIEFFPTDKTLDEELQGIVFQYGHIALDLTTNKELEEEGFARELMRRVQALRKEAGLKKESKVDIFINIEVKLEKWKKQIQERCGAKNLKFESPANCKFNSRGEIKEKIFEIGFN
ncbi:isoleucine--tRNA ligase [Candidatus Woesearchaeota archaeon]|nr:isoleucine--tRNA ligase [Candidatus Woesearchaeota archaeon]